MSVQNFMKQLVAFLEAQDETYPAQAFVEFENLLIRQITAAS